MRKNVSYVENVPETIKRMSDFPLYAVDELVKSCTSRDEVRKVFRENKPVNYKEPVKDGIFITSVDEISGYDEIVLNVNAYTISETDVFLSQNVKIIGYTDNAVYCEQSDGKIRMMKKDITFFTTF